MEEVLSPLNFLQRYNFFTNKLIQSLYFQGKRIYIQAHYECRRHDTPAKPRVK